MVCWRYITIVFEFKKNGFLGDRFIDEEEVEKTLNEQGRVGWELVSATMVHEGLLTLLKQPDLKKVNKKSEKGIDDLFQFGGEAVTNRNQAGDENFLTEQDQDKDSSKAVRAETSKLAKEQSDCLIGEIKIN